jgi:uncharacterized protein involved in exopolysaccharide biosynthesis/Mrp family chromosome partitioning ATPase
MQNNNRHAEPSPSISLDDIYFVLFRHKWKIICLAVAGILAALLYYLLNPPAFQSEAKLFIRYVVDSRSPNPTANNSRETSPAELGESVINSELQILTSFDVAEAVATNIGPEKILAKFGGGSDVVGAANVIKTHLTVAAAKDSSVIDLVFRHPDRALVQPVLAEIIAEYLGKHLQVHQAIGTSDDFLMEETAQLSSQISQTENDLRAAKTGAGIVSVEEAEKFYAQQTAKIREQLFQAEAELAEHQVKSNPTGTNSVATPATEAPPDQLLDEYQRVCAHLEFLQARENKYLTQDGYTEKNKLVVETREQIDETSRLKGNLEGKFPALAGFSFSTLDLSSPTSSVSGVGQAVSLQTKIAVLKQQLSRIQNEAANVDDAGLKISDLQRKKQMEEGNYQSFATSLEQARIDEALGPGRVSNISPIQTPTPPFKDRSKKLKAMLAMLAGGIFSGIAWAFLIEFYFDTSVKRSIEVESRLKMPLFLSIPDISRNGYRHLALNGAAERKRLALHSENGANGNGSGKPEILSWETGSFLNPFYDALRDRLMVFFESIDLTRKPKLVAVTGTDKGAGVSTISAGLAASLSETGDGRVLLVDMNLERGAAQQFFHGKPACHLDDALESEKRDNALVQENLYVVNEGSNSEKLQRVLPKRFASLVPKLKASDYDYIIFDMPPVSQTSVTSRLAGFMDITLLVVESEKTDRDAVHQANALLALSKAKVGAVLNKTRKYIPESLRRESLGDV